jgi:hypothetical protein
MMFEQYQAFLKTDAADDMKYIIKRANVTPLTYAALFHFEESARALCALGAKRDLRDPDGLSATDRGQGEDWILDLIKE